MRKDWAFCLFGVVAGFTIALLVVRRGDRSPDRNPFQQPADLMATSETNEPNWPPAEISKAAALEEILDIRRRLDLKPFEGTLFEESSPAPEYQATTGPSLSSRVESEAEFRQALRQISAKRDGSRDAGPLPSTEDCEKEYRRIIEGQQSDPPHSLPGTPISR